MVTRKTKEFTKKQQPTSNLVFAELAAIVGAIFLGEGLVRVNPGFNEWFFVFAGLILVIVALFAIVKHK